MDDKATLIFGTLSATLSVHCSYVESEGIVVPEDRLSSFIFLTKESNIHCAGVFIKKGWVQVQVNSCCANDRGRTVQLNKDLNFTSL